MASLQLGGSRPGAWQLLPAHRATCPLLAPRRSWSFVAVGAGRAAGAAGARDGRSAGRGALRFWSLQRRRRPGARPALPDRRINTCPTPCRARGAWLRLSSRQTRASQVAHRRRLAAVRPLAAARDPAPEAEARHSKSIFTSSRGRLQQRSGADAGGQQAGAGGAGPGAFAAPGAGAGSSSSTTAITTTTTGGGVEAARVASASPASSAEASGLEEDARQVGVMSRSWLANHVKTLRFMGQGLGWAGVAVGAFFWGRWAAPQRLRGAARVGAGGAGGGRPVGLHGGRPPAGPWLARSRQQPPTAPAAAAPQAPPDQAAAVAGGGRRQRLQRRRPCGRARPRPLSSQRLQRQPHSQAQRGVPAQAGHSHPGAGAGLRRRQQQQRRQQRQRQHARPAGAASRAGARLVARPQGGPLHQLWRAVRADAAHQAQPAGQAPGAGRL
jgi:hypothetical protein